MNTRTLAVILAKHIKKNVLIVKKKECLGLIGMLKEISHVALKIKARNCCEIWFRDVMPVPKNIKFLKVGMLGAGSCLRQNSLFSIKK